MTDYSVEVVGSEIASITNTVSVNELEVTLESTVLVGSISEIGTVEILVPGIAGPAGPQGLAGASGARYVYTQSAAAATWPIVHNLNRKPAVVIILDGDNGQPCVADVSYIDLTTLSIQFPTPVTGTVEM